MPSSLSTIRRRLDSSQRRTTLPVGKTLLLATATLAMAIGLFAPPADAHTALLEASPGPDQTAGGVIAGIDLAFLDPISDAVVTVKFNGAPVPGSTTVANGELIRFEFDEPLQNPGRYQVFYEMTSFDLDYTTSGFFFTYDTAAPPPARLDTPSASDDSSFPIVPTIIGTVVLVAVLGVFVWQFDARRRHALADGTTTDFDDYGGYDDYDDMRRDGGPAEHSYGDFSYGSGQGEPRTEGDYYERDHGADW